MDDLKDEELWALLSLVTSRHPSLINPLSLLSKRFNRAIAQTIPYTTGNTSTPTFNEHSINGGRQNDSKTAITATRYINDHTRLMSAHSGVVEKGRRLEVTIGHPGGGIWIEGWFDGGYLDFAGGGKGTNDGEDGSGGKDEADDRIGGRCGVIKGGYLRRGRWEDISREVSDLQVFLEPFTHLTINQALTVSPPSVIHAPSPPIRLRSNADRTSYHQDGAHQQNDPSDENHQEEGTDDSNSNGAKTALSPTSAPFVPFSSPGSAQHHSPNRHSIGNIPSAPPGIININPSLTLGQSDHAHAHAHVRPQPSPGSPHFGGQNSGWRPHQVIHGHMGQYGPAPARGGYGSQIGHAHGSPGRGGGGGYGHPPAANGQHFGSPDRFPRLGMGMGTNQGPASHHYPHQQQYAPMGPARGGSYPLQGQGGQGYTDRPPYRGQALPQGQMAAPQRSAAPPMTPMTSQSSQSNDTSRLTPMMMPLPMTPSASNESGTSPIEIKTCGDEFNRQEKSVASKQEEIVTPVTPTPGDITVSLASSSFMSESRSTSMRTNEKQAVDSDNLAIPPEKVENRRLTDEERSLQDEQLLEILGFAGRLQVVEFRSGMGLSNGVWEAITAIPHLQRLSLLTATPHPAHASGSGSASQVLRFDPFFLERESEAQDELERKDLLERLVALNIGNLGVSGTRNLTQHLHFLSVLPNPPPLRALHVSTVFLDAALCTSIAEVGSAGHLEELVLSTTGTKLFDAGLREILEGCVGLRRFGLKEVQGRLTKNVWKGIETWPSSLTDLTISIDELGPHHTWFLDHLQSVHHLPFDQLESLSINRSAPDLSSMPIKPRNLHVPDIHDGCIAQPLPDAFLTALTSGTASKLRKLDLMWWKLEEEVLTAIAKACPELVELKVQVEFPLQKLLSLNALITLGELEALSAKVAPTGQRVVEVKSKSTKVVRTPKPSTSPAPAGATSPARQAVTRLPSYLAEKAGIADGSLPIERDVKKFIRKTNKLDSIEFVGHGVWTIIRPRTSGDKDKDKKGQMALTVEFVHSAVTYREAWELGEGIVPEGGYEDAPGHEVISDASLRQEEELRKSNLVAKTGASAPVPTPAEKHKAIAEWTMAATEFPTLGEKRTSTGIATGKPAARGRGKADTYRGKPLAQPVATVPVPLAKTKEIYKRSVLAGLAAGAGPAGGPPDVRPGRGKPIMGSRAVASLAGAGVGRQQNGPGAMSAAAGDKGSQASTQQKASTPPATSVSKGSKGVVRGGKAIVANRPTPFASSSDAIAALSIAPGSVKSSASTNAKKKDVKPGSQKQSETLPTPPPSTRRSSSSTVATTKSAVPGAGAASASVPSTSSGPASKAKSASAQANAGAAGKKTSTGTSAGQAKTTSTSSTSGVNANNAQGSSAVGATASGNGGDGKKDRKKITVFPGVQVVAGSRAGGIGGGGGGQTRG